MIMVDVCWVVGKIRHRHRGGVRPMRKMRPFGRVLQFNL